MTCHAKYLARAQIWVFQMTDCTQESETQRERLLYAREFDDKYVVLFHFGGSNNRPDLYYSLILRLQSLERRYNSIDGQKTRSNKKKTVK